jgi:hypothetical protein
MAPFIATILIFRLSLASVNIGMPPSEEPGFDISCLMDPNVANPTDAMLVTIDTCVSWPGGTINPPQ